MPKKGLKKIDAMPSLDYLAAALNQQSKEMLVKMIVNIASKDRTLQRGLDDELGIHPPDDQLTQQTRKAIADATYYDERDSGTNFDYDQAAYELVEKNFRKLVLINAWDDLMQLSLNLMRDGSEQAESSDETLMTNDIESCLAPVIEALTDADLPNKVVVEWCDKMELADKIGCICDQELKSLRKSRL